jgi:hypothetical protein
MIEHDRHFARVFAHIILIVAPAMLFLVIVAGTAESFSIPLGYLTRDPMAAAQGPWYFGLLSHICVMLWTASGAIACFAAYQRPRSAERKFLIAMGCFTIVLGLDDALMFHDRLLPQHMGVRERYVIIAYAAVVATIGVRWRKLLMHRPFYLLLSALCFFLLSLAYDKFDRSVSSFHYLMEDGSKFLGIVFWLAWTVQICSIESSDTGHTPR